MKNAILPLLFATALTVAHPAHAKPALDPMKACHGLLVEQGIEVGEYRDVTGEGFYACISRPKPISIGITPDEITYHANGTKDAVTELTLNLTVYNRNSAAMQSQKALADLAAVLVQEVRGEQMPEEMRQAMETGKNINSENFYLTATRDDWEGAQGYGYNVKVDSNF